jgi:hypothetical protein
MLLWRRDTPWSRLVTPSARHIVAIPEADGRYHRYDRIAA